MVVWATFHPHDFTTIVTFGRQHINFWKLFWDQATGAAGHGPATVHGGLQQTARLLRDKLSGAFDVRFYDPHTHTRGPLSGTTRVSRYQKGKTNLDFTEARDNEWQWRQLGHMQVCTSLQTDDHTNTPPLSFFTGLMPFLPPNQQRQSTEGITFLRPLQR